MKVSIIIPTYNEINVLGECLDSLSRQTYKDVEVIVVDDGSSDGTAERFKVIKQDHQGAGNARNLGAKKAKGEILVFVDADMTFDKNFIKKLIEPITNGKVKGTFSKNENVSNWESVWTRCWNINEGWEDRKRHPKNYPDHQSVFRAILKSEFDRVGGFPCGLASAGADFSRRAGIKKPAEAGLVFSVGSGGEPVMRMGIFSKGSLRPRPTLASAGMVTSETSYTSQSFAV
jgi:glycosyltransferase involved in cell wall biosynthesis